MKILILSLKRHGDLFMIARHIRNYQKIYGIDNVDLMVNEGFEATAQLFVSSEQVLAFPRKSLQRKLNDTTAHLLHPISDLQSYLKKLDSYDIVVDLCGSRVSQLIKNYLGKTYAGDTLRYNNFIDHFRNQIHFSDLVAISESIPKPEGAETKSIDAKKIPTLCFVGLSSADDRKQLGFPFWHKLFLSMSEMKFIALVHESEFDFLVKEFVEVENLQIQIADFKEAMKIMVAHKENSFFIGVDSALKHLAALSAMPVVELSLGCSHIHETFPYSSGSFVLAPQISCFPCSHTGSCVSQSYKNCQLDFNPRSVKRLIDRHIFEKETEVSNLNLEVFVVVQSAEGHLILQKTDGRPVKEDKPVNCSRALDV